MKITAMKCMLLVVLLTGCSPSDNNEQETTRLTLLHLNDTYRIDAVEDGKRGGFGRVVSLIRQLAAEGADVRLLHGGDFLYPSLESQLWDGEQMVDAMNFMHDLAPLYVVPGNHEFDPRSADALVDAVRQSHFEWIADNMAFATGEADVDQRLRQAYIAEMGGIRVGIVGLTLHADDGGNDREYAPIDADYIDAAERAITRLEKQGAELIIGLTHLHLADDRRVAELREAHPTFQLIAGGHEHEPEFEQGSAELATIVKGASNARSIWRIDVGRDAAGEVTVATTEIAVDSNIAEDLKYRQLSGKWRVQLLERMPWLGAKLGEAAVPLDGRETAVRNEESNWGSFIADQMRGAFGEPADLAFVNGGTLRIDDYIMDDISFEDIGRTFGFSSYLRHMHMSGADFLALLENGYRGSGPSKGYFPQVSGFRVCVDRSLPNGQRIVSLQTPVDGGWQEIGPAEDYTLVAPSYLYGGGDGYDFSAARDVSLPGAELKYRVIDAVTGAQADGETVGWKVTSENRRIVILDEPGGSCWSAANNRD